MGRRHIVIYTKGRFLLFLAFGICLLLYNCASNEFSGSEYKIHFTGDFEHDVSYSHIKLFNDSSYVWYPHKTSDHLAIINCEYESKGKWIQRSHNLIELVSDRVDSFFRQTPYTIELKKEKSDDSIYIQVIPAENDLPVIYDISISNKSALTPHNLTGSFVVHKRSILDTDRLYDIGITLVIYRDNQRAAFTRGQKEFEIMDKRVVLKGNNSVTIRLPEFDFCRLYLEPVNHEYVWFVSPDEFRFRGMRWLRVKN